MSGSEKLSQKQTLRIDLLLLVDLNDLARSLMGSTGIWRTPQRRKEMAPLEITGLRKRSLSALTRSLRCTPLNFKITVFFAFAKVIDAQLEQAECPANLQLRSNAAIGSVLTRFPSVSWSQHFAIPNPAWNSVKGKDKSRKVNLGIADHFCG